MAMSNSTVYEDLPSPLAIRLLTFLPQDGTDRILCSLKTYTDYTKCPPYCALSYCWGDIAETVDYKISCNNQRFFVTLNLYKGLAGIHLFAPHSAFYIWIDAICINQQNDPERSVQVALTKEIYSSATKVYVWLGDIDEATDLAIQTVRDIADRSCTWYYGPDTSPLKILQGASGDDMRKLIQNPGLEGTAGELWFRLRPLFLRPCFRRIWVIQEIQNNSNAWVLCGLEIVHWKILAFAIKWFEHDNIDGRRVEVLLVKTNQPLRPGWGESRVRQAIFMTYNALSTRAKVPFLSVLRCTRACEASDPRDKIFSMLRHPVDTDGQKRSQLDHQGTHLQLRADYSRTPAQVYLDVAMTSISQTGRLDILSYYLYGQPAPDPDSALRDFAWAPRWDVDDERQAFLVHQAGSPLPTWRYNACKSLKCASPSPGQSLVLQGVQLEVISKVCELIGVGTVASASLDTPEIMAYAGSVEKFARLLTLDM